MRQWHHVTDQMAAARMKADVMFDAMDRTQIDFSASMTATLHPKARR